MRRTPQAGGFTLAEVMVSLAGSIVVLGALLVSSIGLQRAFHSSETYAESQADARRIIDYLSRDLRRAIGVSFIAADGTRARLRTGRTVLAENTALRLALPAYYQSQTPGTAQYDAALPLIAAGDRVVYGTSGGPAPDVEVTFRKIFVPGEKTVCFVRDEGDTRMVIVRDAVGTDLELALARDGITCDLQVRFEARFNGGRRLVPANDLVMLRNLRTD